MTSDSDLLRQFASHGDEAAFAEVVHRQADLVYSVALRVTVNPALAQEVTQTVFTLLARRAGALAHYDTLVGWLHTTARHTAINTVRGEERRRVREQEALVMQTAHTVPSVDWEQLRPILDEAVDSLREDDRKAVLLRFFKNHSHQEIGAALGLSEDTARKRVERAVEKLREYFTHRGVTTSSAMLAEAISANSVQAAPVGLVEKLTPASLAGVTATAAGGAALLTLFMSTKTKIGLTITALLALAAILAIKLGSTDETAPGTPPHSAPLPDRAAPVAASTSQKATPPQVVAPAIPMAKSAPAIAATTTTPELVGSGTVMLPNADLKTHIPALIHLIETDDFAGVVDFVMPPDEVASELKKNNITRQQLGDRLRKELAAHGGAATLLNALRMIETREPILDETGTHAAYKFEVSFDGHNEIQFQKINGLWYGPQ